MVKKRKCDVPTPMAERKEECENKEDEEKMERSKTEEMDASTEKTSSKEKPRQDVQGKEDEHSVDSMKSKLGLGAKRTKKPPKSLENFICRPTLRVSQKPGSVAGHSLHPVQKKPYSGTLAMKTNSHVTNTNTSRPSTLPPSSVVHSRRTSLGLDSSSTTAAKKVLPRQMKKDMKSDISLEEPSKANQPQASISHQKNPSTSKNQTSTPSAASCSPVQQESGPQEDSSLFNEDVTQQVQSSPNSNQRNKCESNSPPTSCNRNLVFPKQTSCQLQSQNDSKCMESNSEISLSVNFNLNNKDVESGLDNSGSPKKRYSKTTNKKTNKKQTGSIQQPSICLEDPPIQQSAQVVGPSSPNKCSGATLDSLDCISGTNEQTENKDLNRTLETTMKLTQPVYQQQIDGRTERSVDDEHGKKHYEEEIEPSTSSSSTTTDSTLTQQAHIGPAKPPVNKKHENTLSKKQKIKRFYCNKILKKKNEVKCNLLGRTTTLHSCSQNGAPSFQSVTSLPASHSEQKTVEQHPILKQTQNSTVISEISTHKHQHRKGVRQTFNSEVPLNGKSSQLLDANPTNNETPQDPYLELKHARPLNKKRGRPKQSSSVLEKGTQSTLISKRQDTVDHHMTSKEKLCNTQMCTRSNRLIMKTIIGKINKMEVKRRDKVLTHILLGQKQCESADLSQEGCGADLCNPVSPATHTLSSLVTSFGGKLGPQINVSKRGTIYMGKRRGRKPKYQKNSSMVSKQTSPGTSMHQSLDIRCGSFSGSSCALKNASSSTLSPQIKSALFNQLNDLQHPKAPFEATVTSNAGLRSDSSISDRGEGETSSWLTANVGFAPTLASGALFTTHGNSGSHSIKSRPKGLSCLSSEHFSSAHMQLGSGRSQDSSETQTASPLLPFTGQEAHKFKCHRKGHQCLSRDRIRRHKYKCKKKYMQLRAKRQDPDFLAEVDDLIVRLREVHIVHCITRTRHEGEGSPAGRKSLKGKIQSHDLQCLQEKVHSPTMFQINFSGYYSPHSALACDHPHYVRPTNMRRKHGCSSESGEQIVTHFPVMHKLGYPLSGGGFYHPTYKVPFATTSLGFGLYQGYPTTSSLYPTHFPPSYIHHYSKNPIISPSRFHKKKVKFPTQNTAHWGGKTQGTYPTMNTHPPCDCFSRQSWQKEKQKEKWKAGQDEHGSVRERDHGIEWLLWQNKNSKDHENSGDFSSTPPCSSSVFSRIQNKDKSFMQTHTGTSDPREAEEVRWSEHQPPWRWTRGLESKLGSRSQYQKNRSNDLGDALEGRQNDWDLNSHQQSSSRTFSFVKQPALFTSSQTVRKIRKDGGDTAVSKVPIEQDGTSVQQFANKSSEGKRQCSNSSSARSPKKAQKELTGHRGHKSHSNLHIQDENDQVCQTSLLSLPKHSQSQFKQPTSTTSMRGEMQSHLKSSRPQNLQSLGVTYGDEVKKRGRGRPRKNPHSTPQSLPSTTQLNPQLIEDVDTVEKSERSQKQEDTMLESVETVIYGGQRRGRKRKKTEQEAREGDQNLNKDKDMIKTSTKAHTSSTPIGPPADQVVPTDADFSMPAEKKYLWAGLYSDLYKNEDIPHQPQQLNIECAEYNPEEHEHGLLPPPLHVGIYLRMKRIDFKLPYDIYCLYAQNKAAHPLQRIRHKPSRNPPNEDMPQSCTNDDNHTELIEELDQTNSDEDSHAQLHGGNQQCHQLLKQQEENCDTEDFPLILSSEERHFVKNHSIFLVRNYEKMRARQALLLRQGVREREIENEEDRGRGQSEDGGIREDPATQSDRCPLERRSSPEEEHMIPESSILTQTLQEIWDSTVNCKGSSGQTLSAPLLNLCSRKRSDSALLDFSTVQRQLLSGHYESLVAFHADMLRVFQCAEKYYGSESSVGRDVSQLRASYHRVHQEASAKIINFQKRI